MDPDQCLDEIRLLISQSANASPRTIAMNHIELVEKVRALDNWLTKGGFKPQAWQFAERKPVA